MPIRICSHHSDRELNPSVRGYEFTPSLFGYELTLQTEMEELLSRQTYANQQYEYDVVSVGYTFMERLSSQGNPDIPQAPLNDALYALASAMEEARREEFILPSYIALENAKRMLEYMYRISPRHYEVYPTEEGDISIDAPGGYNRSFVALCYNDGRILCLANINGDRKKNLYESRGSSLSSFVTDWLEKLHNISDAVWLV